MKPLTVNQVPLRVPIDPRIRRRRIEVRRYEGRRRLKLLLAFGTLLSLTGAAWLALRSPLLDLDTVRVEGTQRTSAEDVRRAGELEAGVPLIDLDTGAAEARIKALPWVEQAQVSRRWPGTVAVTVTERSAMATFQHPAAEGGQWFVIDGSGRVLEVLDARPPGLLAIEGMPAAAEAGTTLPEADGALTVVAALSPELTAGVLSLAMVEGGEVELRLNPSGTVRLGSPVDVDTKLRAAETVLAQVDRRGLVSLDVRLPTSPVLLRA